MSLNHFCSLFLLLLRRVKLVFRLPIRRSRFHQIVEKVSYRLRFFCRLLVENISGLVRQYVQVATPRYPRPFEPVVVLKTSSVLIYEILTLFQICGLSGERPLTQTSSSIVVGGIIKKLIKLISPKNSVSQLASPVLLLSRCSIEEGKSAVLSQTLPFSVIYKPSCPRAVHIRPAPNRYQSHVA